MDDRLAAVHSVCNGVLVAHVMTGVEIESTGPQPDAASWSTSGAPTFPLQPVTSTVTAEELPDWRTRAQSRLRTSVDQSATIGPHLDALRLPGRTLVIVQELGTYLVHSRRFSPPATSEALADHAIYKGFRGGGGRI